MESQVGYERFFEPDDIFFSTTDAKGVIQRSNRTFDTLSRYSRERLTRSPHNIIRHLDMPAGVFKLMWDDLEAGRPVCAYVVNRAADGLDYRVFATIVPLRGGYLSVRTKPLDTATQQAAEEVYRRVRARERELAARGASRRQVGEYGGEELARELRSLGFDSLHAMTLSALPREVSSLVSAGIRVPQPPAIDGPVTQILSVVQQIERDTNLLVFELEEYLRLLTALSATKGVMLDVASRAESYGRLVGGRPLDDRERADALAARIIELTSQAAPAMRALPERMSRLQNSVLELRFSVGLMRLLTLMVGRFARSVLDGSEEEPVASMNDLCGALEDGFSRLAPLCGEVERGVAQLDAELGSITPNLDRAVRRLSQWVDKRGGGKVTPQVLDEAAALAQRGTPEVRDMAALAAECRGLHLPFDEAVINQRLAFLRSALAQLA
ncbi:diguanylate cyclase [Actinomyces howellii]|uniref:Aerotaxis receptor n=1 Tax=Actinomyces howellii TaxID=52771 RepID=A0A448HID2_9ACTO|nr:diguanylate cyclase [Actinomyces howellii]VEG29186.1 Aerotaxis receptor [Actinomyces howellii]